MHECTHARASVGGLDQWNPDEMTLLSPLAFDLLADLLNRIEEEGKWPTPCTRGRASFLSKDSEDTLNPLAYRVLLILPTLYRRWASLRLHDLGPWTATWAMPEMCAGVEGKSVEDGWWKTNLLLEEATASHIAFIGGAVDIMKCFDQIERHFVYDYSKRPVYHTEFLQPTPVFKRT